MKRTLSRFSKRSIKKSFKHTPRSTWMMTILLAVLCILSAMLAIQALDNPRVNLSSFFTSVYTPKAVETTGNDIVEFYANWGKPEINVPSDVLRGFVKVDTGYMPWLALVSHDKKYAVLTEVRCEVRRETGGPCPSWKHINLLIDLTNGSRTSILSECAASSGGRACDLIPVAWSHNDKKIIMRFEALGVDGDTVVSRPEYYYTVNPAAGLQEPKQLATHDALFFDDFAHVAFVDLQDIGEGRDEGGGKIIQANIESGATTTVRTFSSWRPCLARVGSLDYDIDSLRIARANNLDEALYGCPNIPIDDVKLLPLP